MVTRDVEVIRAVQRGDHDVVLDSIIEAARSRQRSLALGRLYSFSPGDHARITNKVRPKYLAGCEVEIVKVNHTRAVVKMLPNQVPGSRWAGSFSIPAGLLEEVGA